MKITLPLSDASACEICINCFEVYVEGKVFDIGRVCKYAEEKVRVVKKDPKEKIVKATIADLDRYGRAKDQIIQTMGAK
jgi:hypothetical protein